MKRPIDVAVASGGEKPFPDADWMKRFPILCEMLAHDGYDDGTPREQSTITIREQDGLVLVSLQDKDMERGLYRTGKHVLGALEAIEKCLANASADWRPWKEPGGKRGKKA